MLFYMFLIANNCELHWLDFHTHIFICIFPHQNQLLGKLKAGLEPFGVAERRGCKAEGFYFCLNVLFLQIDEVKIDLKSLH